MLNAIMTCLKLKEIECKKKVIEKYNYDTQSMEKVEVDFYTDLINKPIGLLLQKEFYKNKKGEDAYRMDILCPFDSSSRLTASEIIDGKTKPEKLERIKSTMKDKGIKKESAASANIDAASEYYSSGEASF